MGMITTGIHSSGTTNRRHMGKYNWSQVYIEARREARNCDSWTELRKVMGMPRRSLKDGLMREFDIEYYEDLLEGDDEIMSSHDLERARNEERRLKEKVRANNWILEAITDGLDALNGFKTNIPRNVTDPVVTDHAIVALVGDWHWGQQTNESLMGEFAEYNTHIADRRLGEYFGEIARVVETTKIDTLYLVMLGDEVEGSEIRDTQTRVISSGIVTQMLQFFSILSSYIEDLTSKFLDLEIKIIGVSGNHTRLTKTKTDVIPTETMDYCGYAYMMALLGRVPCIQFNIAESWHVYEKICGHGFYITHGDGIRSYRGLPAYGLIKAGHSIQSCLLVEDKDLSRRNPDMLASDIRFVDYMVTGHFHSDNMLEDVDVEIITNGSPTGTSPYAAKDLRRAARPSQTILIVNEDGVYCKIKKVLK